MTPQEAYNRGLDDAENRIIETLEKILRYEEHTPFLNPKMEIIKDVIKERSDYYVEFSRRNNNFGKQFKHHVIRQTQHLDKLH